MPARNRWRWLLPLLLASTLVACAGGPRPAGPHTIYLVGHGWHTGIVLPWTEDVARAWPTGLHPGQARFVEVGWGERTFYPAPRNSVSGAVRALLWPNESVLHLVAFDVAVAEYFAGAERVVLELDEEGYRRLVTAIGDSFARAADGAARPDGPGLYGNSRFYRSRERYHLFHTCNVWTAEKLQAAGVPLAPWRAVTAGMLLRQARPLSPPE